MTAMKIELLFVLLSLIVRSLIAQHPVSQLSSCAVTTDPQTTYNQLRPSRFWFTSFNYGGWHVKELRVYKSETSEIWGRYPWFGQDLTPGDFISDENKVIRDFVFTKTDETVECGRATWAAKYVDKRTNRYACPDSAFEIDCPQREIVFQMPPTCTTNDLTRCNVNGMNWSWQCNKGRCLHSVDTTRCLNLLVYNTIPIQIRATGQIYSGFRVTDCLGNIVDLSDGLSIEENGVGLLPIETRQKLTVMQHSNNFVQLMISMCPRTLIELESLIAALTEFVLSSNKQTTFIALSVFDGAKGFVDLVPFTQNFKELTVAFEGLRNYTIREYSCNVKQAVSAKLDHLQQFVFGQPWDRMFYIVFSATTDIANYKPTSEVTRQFSKERATFVYFVGLNIPVDQQALYSLIGGAGFWNLNDGAALIPQFQALASNVKYSYTGEYLFGYCSPSRVVGVTTMINFTLPSGKKSLIQGFTFDSATFGGSCSVTPTLEGLCTPCSTVIQQRAPICYDCFNTPSATLLAKRKFSQVILRYPEGENITLQLPFPSANNTITYNVYVRQNGLSNPLLFDTQLLSTNNRNIELTGFSAGDLVGVAVDWRDQTYQYAKGIKLAPYYVEIVPPLAPPVAVPVKAPNRPISSPVSVVPMAAPKSAPISPPSTIAVPIAVPKAEPAAETSAAHRVFGIFAVVAVTLVTVLH